MISRAKGVSYGSVCEYTKRVIKALNDLAPKYIFWPDEAERSLLSRENHQQFGFRGCISSTDGTHIVLSQKPGLDGEVFFNRKHTYSMNVLLTFDRNRQIRYVLSGWPGSVHDNTIWENGKIAKAPTRFFSAGQFQLGDSGFRLTPTMIVPYRHPAASLPLNQAFNERLSAARVVSEHGNGILKARWQSLRALPICVNEPSDVQFVCDWISACCVLHNIVNQRRLEADRIEYELDIDGESIRNVQVYESSVGYQVRLQIQQDVLNFWSDF